MGKVMASSSGGVRSSKSLLSSSRREEWSRKLVKEGKKINLGFDKEYETRERAWPLNYAAARRLLRDKKPRSARLEKAKPTHGGEMMNLPGAMRPITVNGFQVYPHPGGKIIRVPEAVARAPVLILEELRTCVGAVMRIGDVPS